IMNGSVIVAGAVEEAEPRPVKKMTEVSRLQTVPPGGAVARVKQHHLLLNAVPDQVIPDDLIVQGSACVGLDCVNNESFSFDTIRLKENNTRLAFNDTSSAAGFPTRDWRIRANDSANGGRNAFFIDDMGNTSTGAEPVSSTPFTIISGAPTNAAFIDSIGRLGLRTGTPVLDVHVNTSNTPAIRLEQNSGGGFTAQTWDIAGNEANFFVRDVTGGSRLPFRIRPGAPTSSIDINASGNVGIGTASPAQILHSKVTSGDSVWRMDTSTKAAGILKLFDATGDIALQTNTTANAVYVKDNGNVGIGTTAPDQKLSVIGDASKTVGGSWQTFSDERLKTIKGQFTSGLKAVMQLQPIRYELRRDNALGLVSEGEHIGFGAQAVQKIVPEAVTKSRSGYLMLNNDPIIWTMLNAIKEQQKEIEQLKGQIRQLRASRRRK
ncbi:MAG: tail fiber domain-containing protein, partial [Acidobacteriota bacterium]|nr:tail fiber domain-containing protein [Acidobacteriota bacterium]